MSRSINRVIWGAASTLDTGRGHYSLVEWEVQPVPEPGTLLLMATSLAGVAALTRRRR